MEVGDKIVCKREYGSSLTIGKEYIICRMWEDRIFFKDNEGYEDYFHTHEDGYFYIWDYFYTEQEVRKLKLERIER